MYKIFTKDNFTGSVITPRSQSPLPAVFGKNSGDHNNSRSNTQKLLYTSNLICFIDFKPGTICEFV